ncbi:MAG TPA: DciA family protein [Vicinamibacterales bacterium]|nr:DciA family protein [Vicinamibacterales bacterium]
MVPLQNFATGVLADVIRRQPSSPARTAFAWTVAVGPALARSTTASLSDTVLTVRARDPRWAREIERAADTILTRMQDLLGPGSVQTIEIEIEPRLSSPGF